MEEKVYHPPSCFIVLGNTMILKELQSSKRYLEVNFVTPSGIVIDFN